MKTAVGTSICAVDKLLAFLSGMWIRMTLSSRSLQDVSEPPDRPRHRVRGNVAEAQYEPLMRWALKIRGGQRSKPELLARSAFGNLPITKPGWQGDGEMQPGLFSGHIDRYVQVLVKAFYQGASPIPVQ